MGCSSCVCGSRAVVCPEFGGVQSCGAAFRDVDQRRRGGSELEVVVVVRDARGEFERLGMLLVVV